MSDHPEATLAVARRRVAARYPGCARAILSDDPAQNWDRGELLKREVAAIEKEAT